MRGTYIIAAGATALSAEVMGAVVMQWQAVAEQGVRMCVGNHDAFDVANLEMDHFRKYSRYASQHAHAHETAGYSYTFVHETPFGAYRYEPMRS